MKQLAIGIVCALTCLGAHAQTPAAPTSFEESFMAASAEWYRGSGAAWGGEQALSVNESRADPAACRILTEAVAREGRAAEMFAAMPARPADSTVPQALVEKVLGELASMKRAERMRNVACGT
ncbi:MAG: hypothetical protein GC155_03530 [Alphaproteobacteria bacterium]|nr:hypothetical protein [Alphaproteobacteria bacterium]